MTNKTLTAAVAAGLLGFGVGNAQGADLFNLNLNVTTPRTATASTAFSTITGLANSLQTQNLTNLTSSYTINSAAVATLNIRGLPATASYVTNSPVLTFVVPSAGINVTFNGLTRDESQQLFKDFLLKNGGDIATKLLQALVAHSPIDPVAGNPNSMQNMGARSDFGIGTGIGMGAFDPPDTRQAPPAATALAGGSSFAMLGRDMAPRGFTGAVTSGPSGLAGGMLNQPSLASAGGDIGFAMSGGYTTTMVSVPLRYIIPFGDPRYAVTLDMPLAYSNTAGASSYFGSFGVSLRIPVLDNWYITPSVRTGVSGSIDLGGGAIQYSGGLASRYDLYKSDLRITFGNAVTFAKTAGLQIGGIQLNYDLTNVLFNNGIQVEGALPYQVFGHPTSWQAWLIDTYVAGSKVYLPHYDEIGVSVGTRQGQNTQDWNAMRVGASFLVGAKYTGFKLAFSARF